VYVFFDYYKNIKIGSSQAIPSEKKPMSYSPLTHDLILNPVPFLDEEAECFSLLKDCVSSASLETRAAKTILSKRKELYDILLKYPPSYEAFCTHYPIFEVFALHADASMTSMTQLGTLIHKQMISFLQLISDFDFRKYQFHSGINVFSQMKAFDQLSHRSKLLMEWKHWNFLDRLSNWELKEECRFVERTLLDIAAQMIACVVSCQSLLSYDFTSETTQLLPFIKQFKMVLGTYGDSHSLQELVQSFPCLADLWCLALSEKECSQRLPSQVEASALATALNCVIQENVGFECQKRFQLDNILSFVTRMFGDYCSVKNMIERARHQAIHPEIGKEWKVFLPWVTHQIEAYSSIGCTNKDLSTEYLPSEIYGLGLKAYHDDDTKLAFLFLEKYREYVVAAGGDNDQVSVEEYRQKARDSYLMDPQQDYHLYFLLRLQDTRTPNTKDSSLPLMKWESWQKKFNIADNPKSRLTFS
jgi:hypothetical protein